MLTADRLIGVEIHQCFPLHPSLLDSIEDSAALQAFHVFICHFSAFLFVEVWAGMACDDLLQGIFPTRGSNLGLLHSRQIHYYLSQQRSPYLVTHQFHYVTRF